MGKVIDFFKPLPQDNEPDPEPESFNPVKTVTGMFTAEELEQIRKELTEASDDADAAEIE